MEYSYEEQNREVWRRMGVAAVGREQSEKQNGGAGWRADRIEQNEGSYRGDGLQISPRPSMRNDSMD